MICVMLCILAVGICSTNWNWIVTVAETFQEKNTKRENSTIPLKSSTHLENKCVFYSRASFAMKLPKITINNPMCLLFCIRITLHHVAKLSCLFCSIFIRYWLINAVKCNHILCNVFRHVDEQPTRSNEKIYKLYDKTYYRQYSYTLIEPCQQISRWSFPIEWNPLCI